MCWDLKFKTAITSHSTLHIINISSWFQLLIRLTRYQTVTWKVKQYKKKQRAFWEEEPWTCITNLFDVTSEDKQYCSIQKINGRPVRHKDRTAVMHNTCCWKVTRCTLKGQTKTIIIALVNVTRIIENIRLDWLTILTNTKNLAETCQQKRSLKVHDSWRRRKNLDDS